MTDRHRSARGSWPQAGFSAWAAQAGLRRPSKRAAKPAERCTFRVRALTGLWRVSRDGLVYGDFLTRDDALRAAHEGARACEAQGRAAEVILEPQPTG